MGTVFFADDVAGGPPVAVKLVKRELLDDGQARARFDREAKALERLAHPNIVRFFDTGESNDLRYIAMELLEGQTLKSRLASTGRIPWKDTLPIVRAVASALQAAHGAGLIHRDLKPENIFLSAAARYGDPPQVKLLDFGIARHVDVPPGQTMTATGVIVGTPGFVAPEIVLKGPSNDPRSDFYGLGATWYEMLTGARPFDADTPMALAMLHVSQPAPRPGARRPDLELPPRLEALLMSLLAKTPEARPPNADVLLLELSAIEAEGAPARAAREASTPPTGGLRRRAPDLLPGDATATAGFTSFEAAFQPRAQRSVGSSVALAGGLAPIAVLGLALHGRPADHPGNGGPPPAPAPPPSPLPSREDQMPNPASSSPPPECVGQLVGTTCLTSDNTEEQLIRLVAHVEVNGDTIRGKGFARVNGGSGMFFWGSSTPPTVIIQLPEGALDAACRAQLTAGSGPSELVGRGAFSTRGAVPSLVGTFTLAHLDRCGARSGDVNKL
jgi:serine/threonine-protein kinase